ncbi:hypothetical protein [Candidatus Thiosymbion oneisti]|uniref:hypothetical protein n=1 Tax=Candidatus Thiosymbion oneisti TaxID=589554 RepID=UPI000B800AAB|nr:hypothetical protein [Candidatus Thiosymbion oneisti]
MGNIGTRTKEIKDTPRDPIPWLAVALAVLAYFPFLFSTQCLYPLSIHGWEFISKWHGKIPDMGYWELQAYWYKTHTGRYTAVALETAWPYWHNLTLFRLLALIDLLLIPVSTWWLFRSMMPGRSATLITALVLVLYLHQLSNTYDSLLRFDAIIPYHTGLIATLLFTGLLIRQLKLPKPNWFAWFGTLVLGVFTIGTNEISMIQLLGITTAAILIYHLYSRRPSIYLWILFACLLAFSIIEVLAPGNFVRMGAYGAEGRILPALWQSLGVSVYLWTGWLADSLLLPAGLLWVLLLASKRQVLGNVFTFGAPLYWLTGLLLITPVSLFPLLYGTGGHSLAERVVDLIFFTVTILWFGTIAALFESYGQRLQLQANTYRLIAIPLSAFLVLHLFADGLGVNRQTPRAKADFWDLIQVDSNIGKGWLQVIEGTALRYAREMERTGEMVKQCSTDTCVVTPPTAVNFIGYDPLYDQLWNRGDIWMGKALGNPRVKRVVYEK